MDQMLRDVRGVSDGEAPDGFDCLFRIGQCFKESTSQTIWRVRADTGDLSYQHWDDETQDFLVVYCSADKHGSTDPEMGKISTVPSILFSLNRTSPG